MKMNAVSIGMNKFCGPAVLSILTGKSTDDCARIISQINGQYRVQGVQLRDLLTAADRLGYDHEMREAAGSLYTTLIRMVNEDGIYIVTVTGHFVVIEVNDKKIYFCDNHTKEPMPAASSARLLQKVLAVNKVFRRQEPVLISNKVISERDSFNGIVISIYREKIYDMPKYNKKTLIITIPFNDEMEVDEFIYNLRERL